MKLSKLFFAMVALVPALAFANSQTIPLDHVEDRSNDKVALQNGAKLFVNYCLNCHAATAMRYNRLRDIGLNEEQIKTNLLFTGEKVGDLMKTALSSKDAKEWFGAVPPDLSVIARAKASSAGSGADWLYTYLRSYYKDDTRPTGWNNLLFPNVGMPHVLWELQGVRSANIVIQDDPHDSSKIVHKFVGYEKVSDGKMTATEYDHAVTDLVAYLQWMGEPTQNTRKRLGVWVLLFLSVLGLLAWRLNASYWKEVK